eukprot:332119-Pyramimonas_sp.AAC.2
MLTKRSLGPPEPSELLVKKTRFRSVAFLPLPGARRGQPGATSMPKLTADCTTGPASPPKTVSDLSCERIRRGNERGFINRNDRTLAIFDGLPEVRYGLWEAFNNEGARANAAEAVVVYADVK